MKGLIQFVAAVDTPTLSPFEGVDFFEDLANSWDGLAPAGSVINLYLHQGYVSKSDLSDEVRHQNESISGAVQTQAWRARNDDELIAIDWVERTREVGQASEKAAFDAFNKHLSNGGSFTFYEDYDFDPEDFYLCKPPKKTYRWTRVQSLELFGYKFEIRRASDNQPRDLPIITPASAL